MKGIKENLRAGVKAISMLIMSIWLWLLFFLWLPDFMTWLSAKLDSVVMGSLVQNFIGTMPLAVMVSGLSLLIFLGYLAVAQFRSPEVEGE